MQTLTEAIRQTALGAVDAACPVAVEMGSVVTASPLTVRVEQKLTLTERFLLRPAGFAAAAGDTLAMLRVQGGQRYLILFRVQ